ncbi:hypothetical protein ACFSJM_07010 [Lactococcus formosensis subsp. bovis]|uniref:hypothetical protein n=1 Tax=Lactococcus formosensis TaxID=1281486 RepID=UPI001BCC2786|nr:hypothetical protein [Lactococcus formosensis]
MMNIINSISAVFSGFSWETLSAVGTIGAVWLTMKELRKTVSYRNKYILEINLYSTMGIPSPLTDSRYTELTSLSFKVINKSDRNLEEYDISLEKKSSYYDKITSYSNDNVEFPLPSGYEFIIKNPFYYERINDTEKPDYRYQENKIEPFKPLEVFFDLRNEVNYNDNIGWDLKSSIDQGYFSGKLRVKITDSFNNTYYSKWHKIGKPKKIKPINFNINKKRFKYRLKIKNWFVKRASKKREPLIAEYNRKLRS